MGLIKISEANQLLTDKGLYHGPIDVEDSADFVDAIRQFQKSTAAGAG